MGNVCEKHDCILCEQSQSLLEAMSDQMVKYEAVIEAAKGLLSVNDEPWSPTQGVRMTKAILLVQQATRDLLEVGE